MQKHMILTTHIFRKRVGYVDQNAGVTEKLAKVHGCPFKFQVLQPWLSSSKAKLAERNSNFTWVYGRLVDIPTS